MKNFARAEWPDLSLEKKERSITEKRLFHGLSKGGGGGGGGWQQKKVKKGLLWKGGKKREKPENSGERRDQRQNPISTRRGEEGNLQWG